MTPSAEPRVTLTTDGAVRGNPGPGGWAALLEVHRADGTLYEKLVTGEIPESVTNNAMELLAVVGGLQALKQPCSVLIRLDSQYVLNLIERMINGWSPPATRSTMRDLAVLVQQHTITTEWVRGHAGDERNERVDRAATDAANRAYEYAEVHRHARAGERDQVWGLYLITPRMTGAARWWVQTADQRTTSGAVATNGRTENTTTWHGLIVALEATQSLLSNDERPTIQVYTNLELIVKQGRGEWKVKTPQHQPYAHQLIHLRQQFADVDFIWIKTEILQARMDEGASSSGTV